MQPGQNAYEILQVPQDATVEEIEDAYDSLYDLHEPGARAGRQSEVAFLHNLNEAREVLLDDRRRAELDRSLLEASRRPARSTSSRGAAASSASRRGPDAGSSSATTAELSGTMPAKVRRRSAPRPRYVAPPQNNRRGMILAAGLLMVVLVFGLAAFLFIRGPQGELSVPIDPTRGDVIATVNGVPIYSDDWEERLERDKNSALSDPLFAPFVNNFQGVTGTNMLDILGYDAMDKLVNMEVIMQQAKREGLYPTPAQEQGLINEAKSKDLAGGTSFEAFLAERNITEAKYNRTVIQNVVYTVMADRHIPKEGTSSARTDAWIKWICDTRKSHDVRLIKQFFMKTNEPCTSGLPSDLPLPGVEQEEIPEDLPTAVVPAPDTNATPAP
ncbi:MAG: DnaJ domain-containing protein [Chloroflexota bacterium]|nr:DnaJ domain-containing protein [Chloroflexota bacterium]MDQ5864527.1 DnaJ domain-containing protein [Chloroflexota bacterium]